MHGAAFAQAAELSNPFVETSREGFRIALDISAYSLIGLTRAGLPLMEKRGGGSVVTLTFLGSDRVFPNYNVMGVAKAALESSVRYLAADLGHEKRPGERHLGRSDQDAGGGRHLRVFDDAAASTRNARRSGGTSSCRKSQTRRCFF